MEVTTPGVVWLSGKVMVTRSPAVTSDCWLASSWAVTCRVVELACNTCSPGWAGLPSVAETLVTLAAVGRKTAWPSARLPV